MELLVFNNLSVVDQVLPASTSRRVRFFDWKSGNIINRRIDVARVEELACLLELSTEELFNIRSIIAGLDNVVELQVKNNFREKILILGHSTQEGFITDSGNGCPCHKHVELGSKIFWIHGSANEELCGALRETNVSSNLVKRVRFLSMFDDEICKSGHVFETHIFEVEIPKLFLARIQGGVILAEFVASVVAEPDVKSCIGKHKGRC